MTAQPTVPAQQTMPARPAQPARSARPASSVEGSGGGSGGGSTDGSEGGTDSGTDGTSYIDGVATAELPIFDRVNSWFRPEGRVDDTGAPVAVGHVPVSMDHVGDPADLDPLLQAELARAHFAEDEDQRDTAQIIIYHPRQEPTHSAARTEFDPDLESEPESETEFDDDPGQLAAAWPHPLAQRVPQVPATAPEQGANWPGQADESWRVASSLNTPIVSSTTTAGLPQRVPQRHLVPKAMDLAAQQSRADQRDPAQVSAALSAYARGVAGRHQSSAKVTPAHRAGSTS